MTLYKYKSIEHIEDIIVNNRLYCSQYNSLNDPMEWAFISDCDKQTMLDLVKDTAKDRWRICCLSKLSLNGFMWSMYGNEHRGVCVEVEVEVDEDEFCHYKDAGSNTPWFYGDIDYRKAPKNIMYDKSDSIKRVLWTKSVQWEHEKEVRFVHKLSDNETSAYLPVKIKCIYLGKRMKDEDAQYIMKLCEASNVDCINMACSDTPEINYWRKDTDEHRCDH